MHLQLDEVLGKMLDTSSLKNYLNRRPSLPSWKEIVDSTPGTGMLLSLEDLLSRMLRISSFMYYLLDVLLDGITSQWQSPRHVVPETSSRKRWFGLLPRVSSRDELLRGKHLIVATSRDVRFWQLVTVLALAIAMIASWCWWRASKVSNKCCTGRAACPSSTLYLTDAVSKRSFGGRYRLNCFAEIPPWSAHTNYHLLCMIVYMRSGVERREALMVSADYVCKTLYFEVYALRRVEARWTGSIGLCAANSSFLH